MAGIGINTAFEIGRKGLRAQLAGLNVTGHNIANVSTEGFSRQQVNLVPSSPIKYTFGVFGSGVLVEGVRRIRDELVDKQVREQTSEVRKYETYERVLREIETIINEPSDHGIRSLLSEFFDNFHDLANDPEDQSIRNNIREQAGVLTRAFNRIYEQLSILGDNVAFEIERKIDEINSNVDKIADLNRQIRSLENIGKPANDSRDERDLLMDELSEIVDIVSNQMSDGRINISSGGRAIVFGARSLNFDTNVTNQSGELIYEVIGKEDGKKIELNNGELYALLRMKNVIIPKYKEKLNNIASVLIEKVNAFHRIGVGLKGTAPDIPNNNNFFKGSDARTIDIDDAINENLNNIAAAQSVQTTDENGNVQITGSPGDNYIALQIAGLKTSLILNNNTQSIMDQLNSTIAELGIETSDAGRVAGNNNLLLKELLNIRDSNSAVSLDEEFTNLIRYQRGYQASARLVSVVNEIFETLINI